jgi:uncharacterized delta-60 repeat protein
VKTSNLPGDNAIRRGGTARLYGRSFAALLGLLGALAILGSFVPTASASAAPGDLDPTFGAGGIVTSNLGESSGASDVVIQTDGKLVVAGYTASCTETGEEEFSCHSEFLVERYNTNGTLDTSFGGGDGIVTITFGNESQSASSVLIEASGKILVGGTTYDEAQNVGEFAVARLNSDGSLDASFGAGDGEATTGFSGVANLTSWSGSMVLQPDGKIALGGEVYVREEEHGEGEWRNRLALARFNSDGSADTSFGTGGKVLGPLGRLFALTEEPGGKLLAAGRTAGGEFAVARFNSDGSLDSSFGSSGFATLNNCWGCSQADDLLVQSDGKIVATGWIAGAFLVARFDANGALDPSFGGGDGYTVTNFGSSGWGGAAISVALQTDGRIVIAGEWLPQEYSFNSEWAVARLEPNGAPDKSFGTNGLVTTDVAGGGEGDYANGMAIQPDGRIVAVGDTGTPNLAVARYEGGGPPPPTYRRLTITKAGGGTGIVSGPELWCGTNCSADYVDGETVTLNADPEPGSAFAGWSTSSGDPGTCTGTTTPCEVTMNGDVELRATFSPDPALSPQRV